MFGNKIVMVIWYGDRPPSGSQALCWVYLGRGLLTVTGYAGRTLPTWRSQAVTRLWHLHISECTSLQRCCPYWIGPVRNADRRRYNPGTDAVAKCMLELLTNAASQTQDMSREYRQCSRKAEGVLRHESATGTTCHGQCKDPYKPSFTTVTVRGPYPKYTNLNMQSHGGPWHALQKIIP